MTVFEFDDYKACVNAWVLEQPKRGYGSYAKFARRLGTNSVVMSQVFKGARELSPDHAARLAGVMGLGTLEVDYFILLVQRAHAATPELRAILTRQLAELRARGQAVKNRIPHRQLSDDDKAVFYSRWYYIAIWLAAPVPGLSTVPRLASYLDLPEEVVSETLRFLFDRGLLVRKGAQIDFGTNVVHVPHDSPHVNKHHVNWRLKALGAMDQKSAESLHYTAPLSLSHEVARKLREELVGFIQTLTKRVAASPSERLMCLNIDWFAF